VKIRKLEPHEISLHRDLRLCALRDSPYSFAETAADAEAKPYSYWEALTRSVTEPERHVMYLACDGEDIFGSTYGIRDSENNDMARVGGMWVAPLHRRNGIGRVLLESVLSWSREHGFRRLGLWRHPRTLQRSRFMNTRVSGKPGVGAHCQPMPQLKPLNWSCHPAT